MKVASYYIGEGQALVETTLTALLLYVKILVSVKVQKMYIAFDRFVKLPITRQNPTAPEVLEPVFLHPSSIGW